LNAKWSLVDLRALGALLPGSALTDPSVEVPEGHYEAESMKATVVPNRNAIMLSIAFGIAAAEGATGVAAGFHAGDHAIYPDCRPMFVDRFAAMQLASLDYPISLYTPFLYKSKADIVKEGTLLRVPFGLTWSCYRGGELHCGKCGTCVERREAFQLAGVDDPTEYEVSQIGGSHV